ncbi:hypothetical protein ScPMuIL_012503 [Solemya velum]
MASLANLEKEKAENEESETFESYDLYPSYDKLTESIVLAKTRSSSLENVRKLNCWGSEVQDIGIIRSLPNLEVCSLSVNHIKSLEPFSHCPRLQELYIRKNFISDLRDICYLKELEELRILWLADNPCSDVENYRHTVLRNLPKLQKLDNINVTEEELTLASEEGQELCLPVPTPEPEETKKENGGPDLDPTDPLAFSLCEVNKIREEAGLKPLPIDKMLSPQAIAAGLVTAKNCGILQAVFLLLRELDTESLQFVQNAVQSLLDKSS